MSCAAFEQMRSEVGAMRVELSRLAAAVDRLAAAQAGRALSTRDALTAAQLWPAVAEHFAGRAFLARELLDFAAVPLATRDALRDALAQAVGEINDAGAARRFGKFLHRLAGVECGGWTVERLGGADRLGVLWCLRLSEPTKAADNRASA